jgi:hypothetical protein
MYVCVCVYVCMYVFVCVCIYVYMYVCMYVYVCVYVCMYVRTGWISIHPTHTLLPLLAFLSANPRSIAFSSDGVTAVAWFHQVMFDVMKSSVSDCLTIT